MLSVCRVYGYMCRLEERIVLLSGSEVKKMSDDERFFYVRTKCLLDV